MKYSEFEKIATQKELDTVVTPSEVVLLKEDRWQVTVSSESTGVFMMRSFGYSGISKELALAVIDFARTPWMDRDTPDWEDDE
ncbi:hypothetical protein EFM42_07355 [Levilactobacillus brevis]|uniref:hypothetical protein n=1 Tax=Levilactobacillus brevis TaxID=1580 RepID=UPI0021A7FB04|nr:hypothetical protein [Levilactobacillus brevis]MCT2887230.1 hypothetical protein [Levilactobacillus brevis]